MAFERAFRDMALQLASFSGAARVLARQLGGLGVILRLQRVCPALHEAFQPLRACEVTPEQLDRLCTALRRWRFDIVSLDEAVQRIVDPPRSHRRFATLTFDGAYRDVASHGAAVLARHQVPYTIFVPTGFVDGIAPMWWLALEQVIRRHDRIGLVVAGIERRFDVRAVQAKHELFAFLDGWMRTLPPLDLSHAINDLCRRYSVDMMALSREAAMQWSDIRALARDPLVGIGSATVNYPVLARLASSVAARELKMGRQVTEAALDRQVPHFAYPFGDQQSVGRAQIRLADEAGFVTAATARAHVISGPDRAGLHALPRISWDGRSLGALRALTSGIMGEEAPQTGRRP